MPFKRTIEATGIGETTIRSVLKEKEEKGQFESPSRSSRKNVIVDYDEEGIRNVIHAMYEAKEHVTLRSCWRL